MISGFCDYILRLKFKPVPSLLNVLTTHQELQSNLSNTDTEGTEQSVRIREVSVLERSRRLRHF